MIEIARRGVCLVLSAPSGAGKTAIADALLASEPELERSISVTTRARRPAEIDGVHYHFLTEERFQDALRDDALLEWARVLQGTHAYGTPRAPVERALAEGHDVVFDIDWQGHRQLREKLPADVVSVFVLPPNLGALRARLVGRAGDRGEEIERRMRVARDEIRHWVEFDHVVVNEDLPRATETVRAVLHGARFATSRLLGLRGFVEGLSGSGSAGIGESPQAERAAVMNQPRRKGRPRKPVPSAGTAPPPSVIARSAPAGGRPTRDETVIARNVATWRSPAHFAPWHSALRP